MTRELIYDAAKSQVSERVNCALGSTEFRGSMP